MEGSIGKLAILGGVSLKRFGDLRAGGLVGRQLNTGYDEAAGDIKLAYAFTKERELSVSVDHLQQQDVRRTDLLRSGTDRRYDWDPQARQMLLVQYRHGKTGPFIDAWQISFTSQQSQEKINRIAASKPTALRRQDDQVRTEGVVLQANSHLGARQVFTYGLDYYHDRVGSTRNDLNLLTGATSIEKKHLCRRQPLPLPCWLCAGRNPD